MSSRKRAIEKGKTALIALLTASALFLGWRTGLFNDFFRALPFFGSVAVLMRGASSAPETGGASLKEAARPLCIVVTDEDGGRFGARYDADLRNSAYDRASGIMMEALGSASEPVEISEEEWRGALNGAGVFFAYAAPVKLSILYGWLQARMPEFHRDVLLQYICVAFSEDRSSVYFRDCENGAFYGAATASTAGKAQELGIFSANGALFAFETDISEAEYAPYMVVIPGSDHPDVFAAAAGGGGELLDITLDVLGHSDEASANLPDSDGAIRRVGTLFSIRADRQGHVSYRRTDGLPPTGEREPLDEGEMIEMARAIVADTIGVTCGDAEVFFESFEYNAGYYSVNFGYYIAGGRIYLPDDVNAARVSFLSGKVTGVELNFRSFTFTGEFSRLLPERQALAAAGGEFMLYYSDTGVELMQPFWH